MRLTQTMTSAALIALAATALPSSPQAGQLVSADATLGGGKIASASVDARLGGITADVDATLGTTTNANASLGTRTGTVVGSSVSATLGGVAGPKGATASAEAADTIHARARLLGPKRLLKLCITVGGKGCAGASRSKQLALIDARVGSLASPQLASACVAVGGGCGGEAAAVAPPAAGSGSGAVSGSGTRRTSASASAAAKGVTLASAADRDKDRDTRITCRSVLASPARFETGLVKLCRKLVQ